MNLNVTIKPSRSARQQISDQVRELILSGTLAPGCKLPSTHELAKQWNTHVPTVHAALQPLVREGLISRAHRVGTFVCKREVKLTCVGLYYAEDFLLGGGDTRVHSAVHAAIHAAIKKRLAERGIRTAVYVDPRPLEEQVQPWPNLVRAVEQREIQALITSTTDDLHLSWHNKLSVPSAHRCSGKVPNRVLYDEAQFWKLSLHALAKQGCRSVGLIANTEEAECLETFVAVAGELNLEIRDEWMLTPRPNAGWERYPTEQKGYEKFREFWGLPERPDGLVVFPDALAVGVVSGLLEQQVAVPTQLRVVMHKDAAVEMLCPLPVCFVTSDAKQTAEALIDQVLKQTRGEQCEPVILPYACEAIADTDLLKTGSEVQKRDRKR